MPKIHVDIHPDNFLDCYQHTLGSEMDIEFLYGSRDSGKSRHVAQILVTLALAGPKLTIILIRKVFNTIKDSQWQMIKEVAEEWGVDHLFQFNTSPLEIKCASGARFLARGLDDPKKLKSVTNPTHAWVEEGDGLSSNDWTLITTSLRSNDMNTQIWYTFNPDVPGEYLDFWLYKQYFQPAEPLLSFSAVTEEELILVDEVTGEETTEIVKLRYRATHTTWRQNPYCKPARKAHYLGLKKTSEYEYNVYCQGNWGTRKVGDEFFNMFQSTIHSKLVPYNPKYPLFAVLDQNALPYCAVAFWQIIKEWDYDEFEHVRNTPVYVARQVAEAPARPPHANPHGAAKMIAQYLHKIEYRKTGMPLGICGDRSTKSGNSIDEKNRSFFMIVNEQVSKLGYRTEDKYLHYAPPVASIRSYVNAILSNQFPHLRIEISTNCPESIKDYGITKTDRDGGILKVNKADYEGGPSYQHNGHFCDTFKDFIVQGFFTEFEKFCNESAGTHMAEGTTVVKRVTNITP